MVQVIAPFYELITPLDGSFVVDLLARCARMCSPEESRDISLPALIRNTLDKDRTSILRHFYITVALTIDRACAHDLMQSFPAQFCQENATYAAGGFTGELTVVKPAHLPLDSKAYQYWLDGVSDAERTYLKMLELGETLSSARAILPLCIQTQLIVTANLAEWCDILTGDIHADMRSLLNRLKTELQTKIPVVFDDIEDRT